MGRGAQRRNKASQGYRPRARSKKAGKQYLRQKREARKSTLSPKLGANIYKSDKVYSHSFCPTVAPIGQELKGGVTRWSPKAKIDLETRLQVRENCNKSQRKKWGHKCFGVSKNRTPSGPT